MHLHQGAQGGIAHLPCACIAHRASRNLQYLEYESEIGNLLLLLLEPVHVRTYIYIDAGAGDEAGRCQVPLRKRGSTQKDADSETQ